MPPDDLPIGDDAPEVEFEADDDADEADGRYQSAFDSHSDGRNWVRTAIAFLATDVEHDPASLDGAELIAARAEAARMVARIFRAIAAEPGD